MAIEIYKEPELEEMIHDSKVVDEWKLEVEKLGLEGQKKVIDDRKNPSIYPLINRHMKSMFETLCPVSVKYKAYDKSTIPLEILKEISLCVHEEYFHEIYIWYDDLQLDPIVVGKVTNDYSSPLHLVARWGDEVLPMSELKVKAINRISESIKSQYKEMEHVLDKAAREIIETGSTNVINFDLPSANLW